MSTRLSNGVIVRQRSESECHHHVKEPWVIGKARAWDVQLTTPYERSLTRVREKLISRHYPKMLIAKVVRMHYLGNMQYVGYKIRSNYDTYTSKCSSKLRYRGIDVMYFGVKLLYKQDETSQGSLKKRFLTLGPNDSGERSVGEVRQDNLAFQMNATFLKVLREVLPGLLIMESNVDGDWRIRRRRSRTLKRIPNRSGFVLFRCHSVVYPRKKEKENRAQHNSEQERKETYA